jgi:hypothetical protein
MDCCRLTGGEEVGNAPHTRWSPNMLPKQLARGAPLPKKQYLTSRVDQNRAWQWDSSWEWPSL